MTQSSWDDPVCTDCGSRQSVDWHWAGGGFGRLPVLRCQVCEDNLARQQPAFEGSQTKDLMGVPRPMMAVIGEYDALTPQERLREMLSIL